MKSKARIAALLLSIGCCTLFFSNIALLCRQAGQVRDVDSVKQRGLESAASRSSHETWRSWSREVSNHSKGPISSVVPEIRYLGQGFGRTRKTLDSERLENGSRSRPAFDHLEKERRQSKEETAFLRLLKKLTNTTVQSERSCVGANQKSAILDDVNRINQLDASEKFLLPVMLGNQGPNNQLQAFRFVLAVAMRRNYTLVLAPFFNHPGVDAMDMRCFQDTLDPEAIRRLVPVISMDGFRERCHGGVDAVLIGTRVDGARQGELQRRGLELYMDGQAQQFAEMTGIRIPSITFHRHEPRKIIDLPINTPAHAVKLEEYLRWYPEAFRSHSRCSAFVYPYGLLGRFPHREMKTVLSKSLVRPKAVRNLAREVLQNFGKNDSDFVCVHWRFNTEWKDFWCSSHGMAICNTLKTMSARRMAGRFARLMDLYRCGILYFASPSGNQEGAVEAALRRGVSSFFTSVDIREVLGTPTRDTRGQAGLLGDQYHLSLLEQEICSRSKLFIGSELSSWTDNVVTQRHAAGLENMYIMDVLDENKFENDSL